MKKIRLGSTIGILGGGQLGRMMTLSAKQMGYRVVVFEKEEKCPCQFVADRVFPMDFNDLDALKNFEYPIDLMTYEFENIPWELVQRGAEKYYIPQGFHSLKITQDRLLEKKAISALGLPILPFHFVSAKDSLKEALSVIGFPAILKTTREGYDGKGQWLIKDERSFQKANRERSRDCVLEAFYPFQSEASVLVARSLNGEVVTFPILSNEHHKGILYRSTWNTHLAPEMRKAINKVAIDLVEGLDFYGITAIEFFIGKDNFFINEVAPRPHNSGHITIEGCPTSQFEQHLRCLLNGSLGSTQPTGDGVMYNLLGQHMDALNNWFIKMPSSAHLHLYGKEVSRFNRKMGHITFIDPKEEDIEELKTMVFD